MADTKAPIAAAPTATSQAPAPIVNVTIASPDRQAEAAQAMADGGALQMDKADVPGGRYIVNGVETNANGEPVGSSLEKSR